jgi:transposase
MAMIGKIRRMYFRQRRSVRAISAATSLSRNTVRKYLREAQVEEPKYERREMATMLTPFHESIGQALKADARRPKRERRTALALFAELKAKGYTGGYSRLTDFIRRWRDDPRQAGTEAFVPLRFAWGEAFQFDGSEEGLVIDGVYRKLQLAHMKLCVSRAFWLSAYTSQGQPRPRDALRR